MFGSLSARDISEALAKIGVDIDRRKIKLNEPIKTVGVHSVNVRLVADVAGVVTVTVVALAATDEEEQREAQEAKQSMEDSEWKRKGKSKNKKGSEEVKAEEGSVATAEKVASPA